MWRSRRSRPAMSGWWWAARPTRRSGPRRCAGARHAPQLLRGYPAPRKTVTREGWKAMGIRIGGIGAYVPEQVVTNHELVRTLDSSHEWIVSKTGILERRFSAPSEAPSDMGTRAALRCLNAAGVDKADVDLIVVACATPDQSQPAVACLIQDKLGIAERRSPAFDVNSVCAGFVFALDVAQSMMLTHGSR